MAEQGIRTKRTRRLTVLALLTAVVALIAGCASGAVDPSAQPAKDPAAVVTQTPADGADGVSPTAPVTLSVTDGTLQGVALTSPSGKIVQGALSADQRTYTVTEPLGYDATYTWSGTAVGTDGDSAPVRGAFTTVAPRSVTSLTTYIADGQEVGIAAPVILKFDAPVADKAAVEKALTITTTPPTIGSWAWLPDDGGSRVHWRPREYWTPGTAVHVAGNLYGVDYGDGAYGESDFTLDFTIGRGQIVKADATSHRMQVVREGETIMDIPVSYGEGNEDRNVTRSGIHVVTEKYEDFLMSNPPYYENVRERWAVRISNNGEFIHANPLTTGVQGAANVTNGCINLSMSDAAEYFGTARYGDPVEVTGTRIDLSAADGDIYDWAIDWPTWQSMSALPAAATPVAAPAG
ncbi:Ig-like domain-containing protein [Rhodococcus sp. NPDC058505]|uniref:L,D-transpeptidase n=1 Tax=unclassified Rhodococcus (in: high G+C Gram-positive bacteria) TaxID=192944 RepID=UPI0036576322